jgi:hypothetical protein
MSICAVNGREDKSVASLKTWGQLLDALEQGVDTERAVVTAVRFGGVDQPSFREPGLLTQDLAAGATIDVDTCRADVLMAEAVEAALNGLAPLAHAAQQAADAFRGHALADAHVRLAEIVDTLQILTKLTDAITQAGLAPGATRSGDERPTLLEQLGQSLEALIAAATNEDWISVADLLEYDIAELRPRWQAVLSACANRQE